MNQFEMTNCSESLKAMICAINTLYTTHGRYVTKSELENLHHLTSALVYWAERLDNLVYDEGENNG